MFGMLFVVIPVMASDPTDSHYLVRGGFFSTSTISIDDTLFRFGFYFQDFSFYIDYSSNAAVTRQLGPSWENSATTITLTSAENIFTLRNLALSKQFRVDLMLRWIEFAGCEFLPDVVPSFLLPAGRFWLNSLSSTTRTKMAPWIQMNWHPYSLLALSCHGDRILDTPFPLMHRFPLFSATP